MNNIFKGAKFGDNFLTRDGRVAIFYDFSPNKEVCRLLYKNEGLMLVYTNNGRFYQGNHDNYDIVSRYQESISETKFDRVNYAIEILQAWKKGIPIEYYHESSKVWLPFTSPDKSGIISALSDFELRINDEKKLDELAVSAMNMKIQ